MSPWPGAPKSQQSPPINPPSVRVVPPLSSNATMADVAGAIKTAFDGLTIHEQAFAALPAQIAAQSKAAATEAVTQYVSNETATGVTSFNSLTGAVIYFPGLGYVNDQLGETTYAPVPSDNGKKIIIGDSSAVTINFDSGITAPWFTIIDNDSSAVANLYAQTGELYGAQTIPASGFGIVFFDGVNWWAGASGSGGGGGGGTVTSVALTVPARQTVTGSPITSSGTLAITDNTESANKLFAGPASGSAAAPTFRGLVPADVPVLTVGFVIATCTVASNIGPMLAAPRAGTVSKCVIVTKASDPSVALTIDILQNGTSVFATKPTVAAGTASGTVTTSTSLTSSPLTVSAGDVFSINVTAGSSAWVFSAQLET